MLFESDNLESLEDCIQNWYRIIKETLNPEIAKVLFVGNKLDLVGVNDVSPKKYRSGVHSQLEQFDERLHRLKDEERGTEYEGWFDWTFCSATDPGQVQEVVRRLIKRYSI